MISRLLIANRGEIAVRIARACRELGIEVVAAYSTSDRDSAVVAMADEAVHIGPPAPRHSYLHVPNLIEAALRTGADAVHPGYGFLSEDPDFAEICDIEGLTFVGPPPDVMQQMGNKATARRLMADAGLPLLPGVVEPVRTAEEGRAIADEIGYPVIIKAAAGGGGMGMAVAKDEAGLRTEYEKVRGFAERMFGDGSVLIERFFPRVRHVEVQILGLADGRVVALSERECSVQRRNQKLVEEAPSPAVSPELRRRFLAAAVTAGEAVHYRNAGTVEFLLDPSAGEFFFLEMNTRLQVEHPITELIHGIDLVEQQLRIASGLEPSFDAARPTRGHAIELRVNAEDPKRFLPGPGKITTWVEPEGDGIRLDSGYAAGLTVTPFYDSLLAKVIVYGRDRDEAIARARAAVDGFQIAGPKNNLPFFAELLANEEFLSGDYDTGIVARMR